MDDTAQNPVRDDTKNATQAQSQVQPASSQVSVPPPQAQQGGGQTAPTKEHEPVPVEHLRPTTEAKPVIEKEVSKAGVEHSPENTEIRLTPEHKALGIEYAPEATPAPTQYSTNVAFPLTTQQVAENVDKPVTNSLTWLARQIMRQLKRAHQMFDTKK